MLGLLTFGALQGFGWDVWNIQNHASLDPTAEAI